MGEAYIVAATRTAGGRKGGRLSGWHPADLAGKVLDALVDRTGVDPALIEDVIMGCVEPGRPAVDQRRTQRGAVVEAAGKRAGHPVDRQCGSSQQALHFAAQAVMSGTMDIVIAAGVESMSRVPMGLSVIAAGPERLRPAGRRGHGRALSEHPVQPVRRRRDDGQEVRPDQGRARRIRLQQPPEGHRRHPGRRVQGRDHPDRDHHRRRQDRDSHGRRGHPLRRQPGRHAGRQAAAGRRARSPRRPPARSATAPRA